MRDAAERGLRLISYDRPGFGESSPQPGRTVADTAADVRVISRPATVRNIAGSARLRPLLALMRHCRQREERSSGSTAARLYDKLNTWLRSRLLRRTRQP